MPSAQVARKLLGAWYTPPELVDVVVDGVLAGYEARPGGPVRVLDPACGDGRILRAVAQRLGAGVEIELTGCDIDRAGLVAFASDDVAERHGRVRLRIIHDDALARDWGDERFDLVVGNPPFLSQMATMTSRGGASRHGGGPYADAAVEFLALSVRLARPDGGRVALLLPQSILGARDAASVRAAVARDADLAWSWWSPKQQHFDAAINVCALGFVRPGSGATTPTSFTRVVTDPMRIPPLDMATLVVDGTLGDRSELNANFRDEYYALVPAVSDADDGPPLVTSGLIDPGRCHWGERPVTFAKQRFAAPRVDIDKLTGRFPAWAARKLVPKVLVANQTRLVEAVADPTGAWLPGVPVNTVTPGRGQSVSGDVERAVWELAAVLTSPIASVHAWQWAAGTGLSAGSVRLGPALLGATPWPGGDLADAVAALRDGDVEACAASVVGAYGLGGPTSARLLTWWAALLPGRGSAGASRSIQSSR